MLAKDRNWYRIRLSKFGIVVSDFAYLLMSSYNQTGITRNTDKNRFSGKIEPCFEIIHFPVYCFETHLFNYL